MGGLGQAATPHRKGLSAKPGGAGADRSGRTQDSRKIASCTRRFRMTLQARLTLSSVLITTVIVTIVSVVDLGNDMERQFEGTLRSAKSIRTAVSNLVRRTVARERTLSLREALRQQDITTELQEDLVDSPAVLEIAV